MRNTSITADWQYFRKIGNKWQSFKMLINPEHVGITVNLIWGSIALSSFSFHILPVCVGTHNIVCVRTHNQFLCWALFSLWHQTWRLSAWEGLPCTFLPEYFFTLLCTKCLLLYTWGGLPFTSLPGQFCKHFPEQQIYTDEKNTKFQGKAIWHKLQHITVLFQ